LRRKIKKIMMNTNIKATNIELTDAIKDYVNKKISSLEKFFHKGDVVVFIEVGKTTNHHNKGEVFRAEINAKYDGKEFYNSSEKEDLYSAIDDAREQIYNELVRNKEKRMTLYKRGATSVKKMLKGFTKRNPFTSKY
jgi:putative sigma-54 modulation protein